MIDPNHPKIEDQLELAVMPVRVGGLSNKERQSLWRDGQRALGRGPKTLWCTPDEAHALERVLRQMRETGQIPAMMRDKAGHLKALDL